MSGRIGPVDLDAMMGFKPGVSQTITPAKKKVKKPKPEDKMFRRSSGFSSSGLLRPGN